jgi:ectoine hydroxylase
MPEPRAMNIAVFLDEVMPINGPLMLIPRSHRHGRLAAAHDTATTSYPRKIVYLTLNACSNVIRTPTRPESVAHRGFTPIVPGPDDSLLRLAQARRAAAE